MFNMVPKTPLRVTFLQFYGIIEVLLNITKGRYFPVTILSNVNRSLIITFLKRLEYGVLSPLITLRWLASWIIWRPKGTGIFHLCFISEGFVASFLMRPLYISTEEFRKSSYVLPLAKKSFRSNVFRSGNRS